MKRYTIGLLGAFLHLVGLVFLSSTLYLLPDSLWGYVILAISIIFLGYDWWNLYSTGKNFQETGHLPRLAILDVLALLVFAGIWLVEVPVLKDESRSFWINLKNFLIFLYLFFLFVNFLYRNYIGYSLYNLLYHRASVQIQLSQSFYPLIVLVAVLSFVNLFLVKVDFTLDLTPGYYSFSSRAAEIIKSVKGQDVRIFVFLPDQQLVASKRDTTASELYNFSEELRILFRKIPQINPEIQVEILNADLIDSSHMAFGNVSNGTIIIRNYKENTSLPYLERRFYVLSGSDMEKLEQNLIRSLLQVAGDPVRIYFSSRYGERYTTPVKKPFHIDFFLDVLKMYNFDVFEWNEDFGFPGRIPDNAEVMVFAGSMNPLTAETKNAIKDYIHNRKGKLLVFIDPESREYWDWLFQAFSPFYRFQKGNLVQIPDSPTLLYTDQINAIDLTNNLIKNYEKPRFILHGGGYFKKTVTEEKPEYSDYITQEFLFTTYSTWVDVNKNNRQDSSSEEPTGRLPLGLFIYKDDAKIVMFSDVEWITNRYLSQNLYNLNLQLATDILFYLAGKMEIPGILEEKRENKSILIDENTRVQILLYGIILIPLLMIGAVGILIFYYHRKHRPVSSG